MTAEYEYIWRGRQKKYRTQCDYKKKGSFAFQIPAGESIDNMIQLLWVYAIQKSLRKIGWWLGVLV